MNPPNLKPRITNVALTRRQTARFGEIRTQLVPAAEAMVMQNRWQELASDTIAPNVFYEPWVVKPALEFLAGDSKVYFLFVFGSSKPGCETLLGVFPLEFKTHCLSFPVKTLSFWQHRHCYLATPLIRKNAGPEVLRAFWAWFEKNPLGCQVLDTNYLQADGELHSYWTEAALGRGGLPLVEFPRALLDSTTEDSTEYIRSIVPKKRFDEYRRLEQRLSEQGDVRYECLEGEAGLDEWISHFAQLEIKGWKGGQDGAALEKDASDSAYLKALTREGAKLNRLRLLSLHFDGTPIAMKLNLVSGRGGFAFKIAYDEQWSKYSPGVLLEFENIRRVIAAPDLDWMDSCAAPRHPMINRFWAERRIIRRSLFSSGSLRGDLVLAAMPAMRWIKHRLKPDSIPEYFRVCRD